MTISSKASIKLLTPQAPGAVAIFQVSGTGVVDWVAQWTGHVPTEKARLVSLGQIDEGLQILVEKDVVQLMPHGGPRVMSRLLSFMIQMGGEYEADVPEDLDAIRSLFPESRHSLEALGLLKMSLAASPAALPILLSQIKLWEQWIQDDCPFPGKGMIARNEALNHLLKAPRVVLAGAANIGKSTLSNLLSGQAGSIIADMPGTTRDWVGHRIELPTSLGPITVDWSDTPGIRESDDVVETEAIRLARKHMNDADVLILMRALGEDYATLPGMKHQPTLYLCNKVDEPEDYETDPYRGKYPSEQPISALDENTLSVLGDQLAECLHLDQADLSLPWCFDPILKNYLMDNRLSELLL